MRSATPWSDVLSYLVEATGETLYMVGVSTVIATAFGVPLGVWLQLTAKGGLRPNATVHRLLSFVTDLGRSMPFIVLLVALTSVTRLIVGGGLTRLGETPVARFRLGLNGERADSALEWIGEAGGAVQRSLKGPQGVAA